MAGPTIIAHGTEEQKARYLEPLLRAEEIWCQGFSEPGAGSDLAGARTRAVLDGDEWVVNGRRSGRRSRTSPTSASSWRAATPRPRSTADCPYLLVDMKAPGVEVRPLRQITGDPEFNEIFFTDVRDPRRDHARRAGRRLAGRDDDAAARARHARLRADRGTRAVGGPAADTREGAGADRDPVVRDQVAGLWIDLQALRYTNYRSLSALREDRCAGP